jgi:hypothetical protein
LDKRAERLPFRQRALQFRMKLKRMVVELVHRRYYSPI